ncbi:MAG: T9SS type A sorting domain-containing protein [Saprospiraceae bacterium]|nr:T9SS type A sorting domain-containing protein [Saprospiraceae bacterium]
MINKLILTLIVLFIGLQSHAQKPNSDYNIRPIEELNSYGIGDAYPWLSNDAFRLYYCGNNNSTGLTELYLSERTSLDGKFEAPEKLNVNVDGYDNLSPFLSRDECVIAFTVRKENEKTLTEIYVATRPNRNHDFALPKPIKLTGSVKGELISPSFTQDLNELMVFHFYKGQTSIMQFERTGTMQYALRNTIILENNAKLKSGKLSSNGLEYYLSIEKPGRNPSIHIMRRPSLDKPFNRLHIFDHEVLNDNYYRNHQPYFTSDLNHIVMVRSGVNHWNRNDMYIATKSVEMDDDYVKFDRKHVKVFPNPTSDVLYIENLSQLSLDMMIFNTNGQRVRKSEAFEMHKMIDLGDLPSGFYLVHLINRETAKRLVFKVQKINN